MATNPTYQIPFTRFHPPHGRREEVGMEADAETYALWGRVRDAGLRMTVEVLRTGKVSLCIEDPKLGDYDCKIVNNGPGVVVSARNMLERFNPGELARWRAEKNS